MNPSSSSSSPTSSPSLRHSKRLRTEPIRYAEESMQIEIMRQIENERRSSITQDSDSDLDSETDEEEIDSSESSEEEKENKSQSEY